MTKQKYPQSSSRLFHRAVKPRFLFNTNLLRKAAGICGLLFLLLCGILFFRYVKLQIEELRSLRFSRVLENSFPKDILSRSYTSGDVYTLLIVTEEFRNNRTVIQGFSLIRLDMESHHADILTIHPDLSVPLQYIPGIFVDNLSMTTSKVRDLTVIGDLQSNPIPFPYLYYQLEELYALQIDGYVLFSPAVEQKIGVLSLLKNPEDVGKDAKRFRSWSEEWTEYWAMYIRNLSLFQIWRNRDIVPQIESDMSVGDVYAFARDFSALPEKSVSTHVVSDDEIMKVIDEKGAQVSLVSVSAIDSLLEALSQDKRIDREQARVEIFNGTEISGWGSRYERWVKHLGAEVIRVKNAPLQIGGTVIYVTDLEKYAYTVERISTLWDDVKIVEGRPNFVTTGDIIIVLGVDF